MLIILLSTSHSSQEVSTLYKTFELCLYYALNRIQITFKIDQLLLAFSFNLLNYLAILTFFIHQTLMILYFLLYICVSLLFFLLNFIFLIFMILKSAFSFRFLSLIYNKRIFLIKIIKSIIIGCLNSLGKIRHWRTRFS